MFYEKQPKEQQDNYKKMLSIVGSLSKLFSESNEPALYYRAHENIFCKYFEAENYSREDSSADACKEGVGIGLKTWVGNNDQKVAEFGKLRDTYKDLSGLELIKKIAEYRNVRINTTMNCHGLKQMVYHIVKRVPNAMWIYETAFDCIDINNITLINEKGNSNNTYFTDGKHTYHFSTSKNTLYMLFDSMDLLDTFEVNILDNPYDILLNLADSLKEVTTKNISLNKENSLCLRLYSEKNGIKFVPKHSGLNQWNGYRTCNQTTKDGTIIHKEIKRGENEFYIPYPSEDRKLSTGFFPSKDTPFKLNLPDGTVMSAKLCQSDSKAIMSNPNSVLGEWLLRKVFNLPIGELVTYEKLLIFGIDSVVFTKKGDLEYSIDFCPLGTYEKFHNIIIEK